MRSRLLHCLPHFVMLLVSIGLYAAALQIDTGATQGGRRIGPDFWPKAVIIFMGALALYETIKRAVFGSSFDAGGLTEGLTGEPGVDPTRETAKAAAEPEYPKLLLAGSALILAYVVAVDWLGFFVTTALFLFSFTWVGGFRRNGWNALISLCGAFAMVILFMRVAYISLPLGEGPFRGLSLGLLSAIGVH